MEEQIIMYEVLHRHFRKKVSEKWIRVFLPPSLVLDYCSGKSS